MRETLATYPYVVVRLDCALCSRRGRYRLARLADRYGANCPMAELLDMLAGDCKWRGVRPRHPRLPACGARFPDLRGPSPPPPDDPPTRLRLVKGGPGEAA